MARRDVETAVAVDQAHRDYIRRVVASGPSAAEELEKLAALRDRGVISDAEFQAQNHNYSPSPTKKNGGSLASRHRIDAPD